MLKLGLNIKFTETQNNMPRKTRQIRVLIADDHELFLQGLYVLIAQDKNLLFIGKARDGIELIKMAGELKPDVIITDIMMPFLDGIEATKMIKKLYPPIEILGISFFANPDLINSMKLAGARGYLEKTVEPELLLKAVRAVYKHKDHFAKSDSELLTGHSAKTIFPTLAITERGKA